jgi:hypothetical protein
MQECWCHQLLQQHQISVLRPHCKYTYQKSLKEQGVSHQTHEQHTTSTILHAINVVYSNDFIVDFLTINNHKAHVNHKMGTTRKEFFICACACDAQNGCDEASLDSLDNENGDNSNYMLLVYLPGDKYLMDSGDKSTLGRPIYC